MVEMLETKRIISVFDAFINSDEAKGIVDEYKERGLTKSEIFISRELSRRLSLPFVAPLSFGDFYRKTIEKLKSERFGDMNFSQVLDSMPAGLRGLIRINLPHSADDVKQMFKKENSNDLYLYLTESWKDALVEGENGIFGRLISGGAIEVPQEIKGGNILSLLNLLGDSNENSFNRRMDILNCAWNLSEEWLWNL
jgi:hypothetical protein